MISFNLWGVLLMIGAAILFNVQLVVITYVTESGWSDLTLLGITSVLFVLLLIPYILFGRRPLPARKESLWIFAVGAFMSLSSISMVIALQLHVQIGDFAALNSSNVVFAALLGRIFLGERLNLGHIIAVVCSLAGAVLISKPAALFGSEQQTSNHPFWIGSVISLFSGLSDACVYISSRRCAKASPEYVMLSFNIQLIVVFVAAAFASQTWSVVQFVQAPWLGIGWISALFASLIIGGPMFTLAAQQCPAAISATVDTATRMMSGYLFQVVLFGATIDGFTAAGAMLMLASVAAMTLMQLFFPSSMDHEQSNTAAPVVAEAGAEVECEDDTDSLVSFAASEFTCTSAETVRRRPGNSTFVQQAQILGAVAMAA
eukprot:TRINITY_DN19151_c0_g1_i1.p1 TRINITY_DN19151_c0_g1~~TRINITY_DN19151_c0_g1_i1.p1  ORF type:complete len:390 (+),score=55.39 TRINITY_DN19151_c0_g1_i1:49-1170(+)